MPYDLRLAERLETVLKGRRGFEQKRMFGGIGWMLNGNMCVGIYKDWPEKRRQQAGESSFFAICMCTAACTTVRASVR